MPTSCTEPARRWFARPALIGVLAGLGGCTDSALGAGGWSFLVLCLGLVAGLAYLLGTLRERQHGASQLRAARAAARLAQQLQEGWSWQTDAQHRLSAWRAPGQIDGASCALFEAGTSQDALMACLQAELAFRALRLRSPTPVEGSLGWTLSGEPRLDDAGAFVGFVGTARPSDAEDALQWAANAFTPLLHSQTRPALLTLLTPLGWQVQQLNPAAQALWPALVAGGPLAEVLDPLPPALTQALELPPAGEPLEVQGWCITPLAPPPAGLRALLLMRTAPAAPSATAATAATTAYALESETFSSTLSHDLRAPIRVVEGFTRIVKEDYGGQLDRVGNDHLDRVLGAATRMNQMIDALLALARLSQQPLARQSVDLSQLAGFVVDDLRRASPERAAEVEVEAGLTVWGDPMLLRLVLENLFGNAWKYSQRCHQTRISLRSTRHEGQAAFVVRDNGAGFDMASAGRLFGLFQRLHSASDFPGHGVGLASVRRIVRRHGGEVWAEAEVGRGATFFFTLPE